jgi:class 3 adenylate cyclase/tetratricopeptide (TPR) repeat protein
MAVSCPHCGHENTAAAKFCSECGASLSVSETQGRKVVTILFSDVTGSTSLGEQLDPESLRGVMGRFYDIGRAVVARHGGVVEKFIGDALMAVFGVPVVREDDALRAVRTAVDLRDELERLNDELESAYGVRLATRTGLNTGEVAVGAGEVFASGDAVNVAARLEQNAAPGEILLAETTRRLVRAAVHVTPLDALELKGKSAPVEVWRLQEVVGDVPFERQLDTPLVGRDRELAVLHDAYARVRADGGCRLVTVLGPPGIGKSRLVRELVASAPEARALTGRCVPYGDGITYWPIATIVRAAAGIDEDLGADEAFERVRALVAARPEAAVLADRIGAAIGLRARGAPAEEIFWAVRELIETLAAEQPLILVLDDIHWAEPTLLDLIEHLADRIENVSTLLVCLARDELLEARPRWRDGSPNSATIELEALPASEITALIGSLDTGDLDEQLRERIAAAADGNPLFVEEMLASLPEQGGGDVDAVPPTIQALLAARVDRLDSDGRGVAGAASVVGQEFSRRQVSALQETAQLDDTLATLVQRQFLRPAEIRVEHDWFRFWHLLSRDAAYAALPKTVRSDLHERFARFLEREAGERVGEVEELLGYHLEQAYREHIDVALPDERAFRIAGEAAGHLTSSGARASARGDLPAAANLLTRALALLPPGVPQRPDVQLLLGATLLELARWEEADRELAAAEAGASETGSRVTELSAQIARSLIRLQTNPPGFDFEAAVESANAAIVELERLEADQALVGAWRVLFIVHLFRADTVNAEIAAERALECARRAGYVRGEGEALFYLVLSRLVGPTPAADALAECERLLADPPGPMAAAALLTMMGGHRSMLGDVDESRRLVRQGREGLRELGFEHYWVNMAMTDAFVEYHAGDLTAAEQVLEASSAALEATGETAPLSMHSAVRAVFVAQLGRYEEALELAERGERDAVAALAIGAARAARALALSGTGHHDDAVAIAQEAAGMMRATLDLHGTALVVQALGEALHAAGREDEALEALEEAVRRFEQKGCTACATRVRAAIETTAAARI